MAPDRQGRGPSALPAAVQVQEAVGRALREGRPVVALESTIISHGMPYPHNIRTPGPRRPSSAHDARIGSMT